MQVLRLLLEGKMEDVMLAIGHWWLNLIGWKPQAQRVYEQLKRLSPDWPQISDEAIVAIESLSDAFIASQIARGAAHQEIEPYQPQPDYAENATRNMHMIEASKLTTLEAINGMRAAFGYEPLPEELQAEYEGMLLPYD